MQTTAAVLTLLALGSTLVRGAPPSIASSSASLEVLPLSSLPSNFTVLTLGVPPPGGDTNVTIVPLQTPTVSQLPPGAASIVQNLTHNLPDLPASLAGNAYVLSHVVVEIGVLEDVNSTETNSSNDITTASTNV